MMNSKIEKMVLITMIASLLSATVLLLSLTGLGAPTGKAVIGGQSEPLCLWQLSGGGKPVNHLIGDASMCARLIEDYAISGECSDEAATMTLSDNRGRPIVFEYDLTCHKNFGMKRFSVFNGRLK
jgi:hypothetical protein